jgi:hypothetical protein
MQRWVKDLTRLTRQAHADDAASATTPIGPGLIRAAYSQAKFDPNRIIQQLTRRADSHKWAVGYVYLSKRTALYAT